MKGLTMSQEKNSLNKKLKRLALFSFNSFCICTLLVFAARIRGGCAPKSHYTPNPQYRPKLNWRGVERLKIQDSVNQVYKQDRWKED